MKGMRSLAFVGMLLLPLTPAYFPSQARAQAQTVAQATRPERVLSVTGTGTTAIATSLSQVSLGVVVEAQTAQQAQQQAAQRQTAVIEWLRSQNVSELGTAGISLIPRYDYRNDTQVLRGYSAVNTVSFEIETEAAGEVIDGAIAAGATRVDSLRFSATESVIAAARQQALALAVADAQQQADTVLSALNLSRQEIVSIVIGSMNAPPPSPVARSGAAVAIEEAATPVVGASQTVSAQVTLEIRY